MAGSTEIARHGSRAINHQRDDHAGGGHYERSVVRGCATAGAGHLARPWVAWWADQAGAETPVRSGGTGANDLMLYVPSCGE